MSKLWIVRLVLVAVCVIATSVVCSPALAADCANGECRPSGRGLLLRRGVFVSRAVVAVHAPAQKSSVQKSPVQAEADCATCGTAGTARLRFWRR